MPTTNGKYLSTEADVNAFMKKLATDFAYQIRLFDGIIDEVVWTVDSSSWRKDFFPQAEYKGNRTVNESIDWGNFQKVTNDFILFLHKQGVIISKIEGAEGDDLMYGWAAYCSANDKPTLLSTGDGDLTQMVNVNSDGVHTIVFSPAFKKLYTYQGFSEWLKSSEIVEEKVDIFNTMKISTSREEQSKKLLSAFLKKKQVAIIEVDTDDFIFKKVLKGDGGDNVAPAYFYTQTSAKGVTRRYGISEKKCNVIVEEFISIHGDVKQIYLFNDDFIDSLATIIVKVMNAKFMTKEQIVENLKRNVSLMVLSSSSIPPEILDDIFKSIESQADHNNLNMSKLSWMNKILEGTEYLNNSTTGSMSSSIFKKEDSTEDFSFIKKQNTKGKLF